MTTIKNRRQLQRLLSRIEERALFQECGNLGHLRGEYPQIGSDCLAERGLRKDWGDLLEFLNSRKIDWRKEGK